MPSANEQQLTSTGWSLAGIIIIIKLNIQYLAPQIVVRILPVCILAAGIWCIIPTVACCGNYV